MGSGDFLWYLAVLSCRSLALACLAWVALRLCRVQSASVKHAVWTVVAAVMLLQVVASLALPPVSFRVLAPVPDAGPIVSSQFELSPMHIQPLDSREGHLAFTWMQAVVGIYALVAFVLLAQLTFGYMFARRLVRHSKPLEWHRVRESESISVPMTVGQIAPTILLPVGWREWDPAKLQAVLAHESAHVRRADWAIGGMVRINCCVFWFHPLAWWLKRELALLAEYACDDLALAQLEDRRQYARALLEIAYAMKSAQRRLLGVPMAKETNVKKRMEQILDETRPIPPAFGRRSWVALLLCALPVGYFVSAVQLAPAQTGTAAPAAEPTAKEQPVPIITQTRPPRQAQPPAPVQSLAQAQPPAPAQPITPERLAAIVETPYQKWLNQEVTFIISDEERLAFQRLRTDDEREAFIEQFWLRRDPTPGSPQNEMKEEHYRRIAFANDRFTADIPGWQTDRGKTYIKYGPPDTLDTYNAPQSTDPYETWRYRYIEGIGSDVVLEFHDPAKTGRYPLTKINWQK